MIGSSGSITDLNEKNMAHLEVKPKTKRPLWVWMLIALLVILLAGTMISKCATEDVPHSSDSVPADTNAVR